MLVIKNPLSIVAVITPLSFVQQEPVFSALLHDELLSVAASLIIPELPIENLAVGQP